MIKKYILGIVISFVGLFGLSFVNARCDGNNAYCNNLPFGQASDDLVNGAIIDNSFNFRYGYFNFSYDGTRYFNYWWQDDGLYFTKTDWRGSSPQYGKVDGYFVCSGNPFLGQSLSSISSCEYHTGFNDFGSQIVSKDLYGFYCSVTQGYSNCNLCVYSSGSSYVCVDRSYISDTHDTFLDINAIEGRLTRNPYSSGYLDNGGIEVGSVFSAIRYYENTYGRNESICYAGVDNLTSLYGQSSVAFQEGYGLSIFQVFSGLYNGDQNLTHMYAWLNSLLGNYELWFAIGSPTLTDVGNPPYLLNYNSGSYQVDVYYDNLVFPFAGKPVALYYLASNIESQSVYNTMGASVVSYCNLKINGGSYEDIVSVADKNNIIDYTEQSNVNNGLNPDGSEINHGCYFGSGDCIEFSGGTSIQNTLKNFFEEFDKGLSGLDVNTNNRILPTWLVTAFIFVVLFKFLKRR